ncbi:MAG TPA: NAD(P)/FAD-dependent oxidoreductase [Chloroflexota bacterium]|nr:NAD(P)/FAD-dependent oxidoreductase [Chloroflexota bacterium]
MVSDQRRVAVLGAGALGLAAARRLTRSGFHVTLIEREPLPGGLAAGFRVGQVWLEKFYHHIFGTDTRIIGLIDELGLWADMHWGSSPTAMLRDDHIYRLDGPIPVLQFSPLSVPSRLRLGAGLAALKLIRDPGMFEQQTAAEWIRRWMGRQVYEVVWEPLLRGKFGQYAEQVSMSWFWARIYCRTPKLGYLRGGFQQLYEALADEIRTQGSEIQLETSATCIEQVQNGIKVETDRGAQVYDRVLCTLPTRLFIQLTRGLPEDYRERYQLAIDHHSAHCLILEMDRQLQASYWLNINDPGYPFLALVEHTNIIPPADYGGAHLVYLGNYLPPEHEIFTLSGEQMFERYLPHIQRINPRFDRSCVRKIHSFSAHYAQPIVRVGYPSLLAPHRTPIEGVWLANMGHVYPQDRGQNYSLALGERVADMIIQDQS